MKQIKLKDLSRDLDSAIVRNILVNLGDTIDTNQPIINFESSKVILEAPSPVSGKIKHINIKPGESCEPETLLFELE